MTETIGQQLKNARQARHLTIEQVTEATHIRARFIRALEDDYFDALPSPVHARGFLRLYADYLDLSLEGLINIQRGGDVELAAKKVQAKEAAQFNVEAGNEPSHQLKPEPESVSALEFSVALPPPSQSQAIFISLGAVLNSRRESLGLTLDEVERQIHIRKHYLQALESGDFDHLPTSVQARGMLNNYANFLDLQVDTILLRFAEGLQALRIERQPQALAIERHTLPGQGMPRPAAGTLLRHFLSLDMIFGGGLILFLLFIAVWGTNQVIKRSATPKEDVTTHSVSEMLLVSPQPGVGTSESAIASAMITPSLSILPTSVASYPTMVAGHVQVIVIGLERVWVRVTVDGKVKLEGRILAGSAYPFDGNARIEVLTGDGSSIQIIYNTTNLGVMGTYGEVVDLIYTPQDVLKPTQTPLPTATPTPRTTPTVTPSLTPLPSRTPTARP